MEGRQAGRRIHQRGNTAGPSGLLEAEEEGSAPVYGTKRQKKNSLRALVFLCILPEVSF